MGTFYVGGLTRLTILCGHLASLSNTLYLRGTRDCLFIQGGRYA